MMNKLLSSQLYAGLRKIADDPNIIISIFEIQRLVSEKYVYFKILSGWFITEKGKQYLIDH